VRSIERILGYAIERRTLKGFDYKKPAPARDAEFARPPASIRRVTEQQLMQQNPPSLQHVEQAVVGKAYTAAENELVTKDLYTITLDAESTATSGQCAGQERKFSHHGLMRFVTGEFLFFFTKPASGEINLIPTHHATWTRPQP